MEADASVAVADRLSMKAPALRIALAAAIAALLAAGLAACGGDDGDGSSEGGTTTTTTSASKKDGFQPAPLEISGGGSEQYADAGDGSIQSFGEESDEAELEAAAEAVHAFFVARAEGDGDAACARITEAMLEKLDGLASQSERKGCAEVLEDFTTPMSDAAWEEITEMDAGSLRIGDEKAFLIYRGADDVVFTMPLREEDGEWKIETLTPTSL